MVEVVPRSVILKLFARLCASLTLVLFVSACADGDEGEVSGMPAKPTPEVGGKISVFAAASLTEAFQEVAKAFQGRYPGAAVEFNFAGSPTLRTQIEQGARADVFASADEAQMEQAKRSGVVIEPVSLFALNKLVIITPASNPAGLGSAADLAKPRLKLVLANASVPAGAYSRQALTSLEQAPAYGSGFAGRVLANLVSAESNVKQVVAKVELGEADAGIVYRTDVTQSVAPKLKTIDIPDEHSVIARYPIALANDGANPRTARAFIDFVLSNEGQAILERYGFLGPS